MKSLLLSLLALSLFVFYTHNVVLAADTVTVVLRSDRDAFICGCQPNATNPGGPVPSLFQGQYNPSGTVCHARVPIHWNLASIPSGAIILSATAQYSCNMIYGTLTGQMAFYRLIQNWDGTTVTHSTAPQYTTTAPIIMNWPTTVGQKILINVTAFVQFWQVQSDSNFGIFGHSINTTGTGSGAIGYYSSRYTDSTQQPTLTIKYIAKTTHVKSESHNLPDSYHLDAYPNPFNPSTTISYVLKHSDWVKINIVDINGRIVHQLVDTYQSAGDHHLQWNAAQFSSGIYIVSMNVENVQVTKKIALTK
jgi:hypothetical protein